MVGEALEISVSRWSPFSLCLSRMPLLITLLVAHFSSCFWGMFYFSCFAARPFRTCEEIRWFYVKKKKIAIGSLQVYCEHAHVTLFIICKFSFVFIFDIWKETICRCKGGLKGRTRYYCRRRGSQNVKINGSQQYLRPTYDNKAQDVA